MGEYLHVRKLIWLAVGYNLLNTEIFCLLRTGFVGIMQGIFLNFKVFL